MSDGEWRGIAKVVGMALGAAAGAGIALILVARDQMDRHQRNLFSPYPLKRLACLGYMARCEASVSNIHLLRDFLAWERKPLLKNRARIILKRMEDQALGTGDESLPEEA